MRTTAWYRVLALLFGFALVAVACGSDGNTDAGGTDDEGAEDSSQASSDDAAAEDDGEIGGAADQDEVDAAMEDAADGDGEESAVRQIQLAAVAGDDVHAVDRDGPDERHQGLAAQGARQGPRT